MLIAAFAFLLQGGLAHAGEAQAGGVMRVPSRDGSVPVYAVWKAGAIATVVLYSGGDGGYGKMGEDGWPAWGNFLIRTGKLWASHPFNVVMVGRPADIPKLDGDTRVGELHALDNQAIYRAIKLNSSVPIWVIGTSMGTLSAAAAATQDKEGLLSGAVLTSSMTAYRMPWAVRKLPLAKIRIPVLVVHHQDDACFASRPHEAKSIAGDLDNAPIKKTLIVSGGSGETGNPCDAFHWHGYVGMEREVVDLIAAWIRKPTD